MKNLILLFVFFYASNSFCQELMNYFIEPNGPDEITLHTMVYKNTDAFFGGYEVSFDENNINVTLCYLLTSGQSVTFDPQVNNISLPTGYNTYTLNIQLFGDGDGAPCTLDDLVDTGELTFDYPYNPTATTYVPDNVFEDYLEDYGFGDDIVNNDLVYTHRIVNITTLILNELFDTLHSLEGIQDFIVLKDLRCNNHQINELDVSNNVDLEWLWCNNNPISQLDVSNNLNLTWLSAYSMNITTIDVSNNINLEVLTVSSNNLSTIDLSQNSNLKTLWLSNNPFENIDVSINFLLETLSCNNTLITSLDVSNNINLKSLYFKDNSLSSINIINNVLLENLGFKNNQLVEIDVSNLENLKYFEGWNNLLTSLDFSNNPQLEIIDIRDNNLTSLNIKNGNNSAISLMLAKDNDNLYCIEVDNPSQAPYSGWSVEDQVVFSEDCSLGFQDELQSQFNLFPNPTKGLIQIESNVEINTIRVFDILGKLLFEQLNPNNQLDISNLPTGLLFIQIETDKGSFVKKIIKE